MSEGINNRILIIKGILAEKCGLNPDIYDEISEIFEEIQILDKAKDDALVFEREQKLSKQECNCNKPAVMFSEAELKAELDKQKEEIRQWLIAEDFEGLAERL